MRIMYNAIIMNIPNAIVQNADNLSKETGLNFRDCLEILMSAYLAESHEETQPEYRNPKLRNFSQVI